MADGIIPNWIETWLGKNFKTSFWGGLTILAVAINQAPTIIDFLPDNIKAIVRGISGLIAVLCGIQFVSNTKDKTTTGIAGYNAKTEPEVKVEDHLQGIVPDKQ